MSQRRINLFGALIDTADMPEMISHLVSPTRLLGNEFSVAAPDLMQISAGSCLLPDGVLIIEDEIKYLVIPNSSLATDYTVIYQLEDTKTLGGSPAILRLISGTKRQSNFTDGTVLGWIRYPGGSIPLSSAFFIQPTPLRLTPKEAQFYTLANCPLQGTVRPPYLIDNPTVVTRYLSLTGTTTTDLYSNIVTMSSVTNLKVGMDVQGTGIPSGTTITNINLTQSKITISNSATVAGTTSLTFAPMWLETVEVVDNELCSRFVNTSAASTSITLKFPFTNPKYGVPRKVVTRLLVDFNCFATFSIHFKGNVLTLSPNSGLVSNTGSLMTREFDVPSLVDMEWLAGGSAHIEVTVEAQPSRGISFSYVGVTTEPSPFTLFT